MVENAIHVIHSNNIISQTFKMKFMYIVDVGNCYYHAFGDERIFQTSIVRSISPVDVNTSY